MLRKTRAKLHGAQHLAFPGTRVDNLEKTVPDKALTVTNVGFWGSLGQAGSLVLPLREDFMIMVYMD